MWLSQKIILCIASELAPLNEQKYISISEKRHEDTICIWDHTFVWYYAQSFCRPSISSTLNETISVPHK